jgi:hypothetical protein
LRPERQGAIKAKAPKAFSTTARSKAVFKITKIPKPDNLPAKRAGDSKYPFADMQVGDSFVVPYSEMREGETADKFRERVYKSAREYARRNRKTDEDRMEFTAAVMEKDDESEDKAFVQGDVVVWRDK